MKYHLDKHVLANGMTLLGEPIEQIESVAFAFLLPAGAARMSDGCCGAGTVISDWIFRGAGDRDSRQLLDALDSLGLHRGSSVTSGHLQLSGNLVFDNLLDTLQIYADVILQPRLGDEQFELARQLALQEVLSLDDDPRQNVMLELYERYYPHPLGTSVVGRVSDLETLTAEKTRQLIRNHFTIGQSILAVAGKYDFDAICRLAEKCFADVPSIDPGDIATGQTGQPYTHLSHEGAQVHIGLMTQAVPGTHPQYYDAMTATSILSGGMSSRLFTEVREKRGLCYAVAARYHALKGHAGISCYAGTTPDKAQETYDVTCREFMRLAEDISADEIQRAQIGLKSSLILQSESSSARAKGIARDYYLLGRVRTLNEIRDNIEKTGIESVTEYLHEHAFDDFTVVTIGPKAIDP